MVKARIASSHSACELGVMQPLASQFAPNETVVHVRGAEGGAWCPCLAEGGGGDDAAAATLIITPRARRVAQRILGDYRQIRRQVSLRAAAICGKQPFLETFAFIHHHRKEENSRTPRPPRQTATSGTRFVPR